MIKALIFDLDGVISDTQNLHDKANSEILSSYGINISAKEITKKYAGIPQRPLFFHLFKKNKVGADLDKAIQDKWKLVMKRAKEVKEIPGSVSFVKKVFKKNYFLSVASSGRKKFVLYVIKKLKIQKYFKVIISSEEVKRGKPYPDIFLETAENLKVNPEDCLVFEDTPTGVEAAKRAGMKCIAITTTHKKEELKKADKIIDSFNQLTPDIINNI